MKLVKLCLSVILLLAIPFLSQIGTAALFIRLNIVLSENMLPFVFCANLLTLVIYLVYGLFKKHDFQAIYRLNPVPPRFWGHILILGISSVFFSAAISGLFNLGDLDPETVKILDSLMNNNDILFSLLTVGLWVPIVEELVFRGALTSLLSRNMNVYIAIFCQALLFGLFHLNLVQLFPSAILGITMGLTAHYTKSLFPAIAIHMMNNSLVILLSQALSPEAASAMAESAPPSPSVHVAMLVTTGTILLLTLRDLSRKTVTSTMC